MEYLQNQAISMFFFLAHSFDIVDVCLAVPGVLKILVVLCNCVVHVQ